MQSSLFLFTFFDWGVDGGQAKYYLLDSLWSVFFSRKKAETFHQKLLAPNKRKKLSKRSIGVLPVFT